MPPRSVAHTRAREVTLVVLAQAGAGLAAPAVVKLLTSLLPPAEFGSTAVATSYVAAMLAVLAPPVSGAGTTRFHDAVEGGRVRQLLGTLLVLAVATLIVPAILFAARAPLESLEGSRALAGLVGAGLVYLAAELLKTPALAIASAARWRGLFALLVVLDGWGKVVLVAGAAGWIPLSARTVFVAYAVNSAIVAVIGWTVAFRSAPAGEARPFFSTDLARAVVHHGWFFAGIGVASWLITLSDRVLLGTMVPAHDVGIYVAGSQAAGLLPLGLSALMIGFASPILLQKQAADPERAAYLLGRLIVVAVWLLLPAAAITMAARDFVVGVVTSGRYLEAGSVVVWTAPALACLALSNASTMAFWMTKRVKEYFAVTLLAGAVNVSINLTLVPRYGITAAAIATFVTYAVQLCAALVLGRRHVRWHAGAGEVAAVGLGAAGLAVTLVALADHGPGTALPVGLAAYTLLSVGAFLVLAEDGRHAAARVGTRLRQLHQSS